MTWTRIDEFINSAMSHTIGYSGLSLYLMHWFQKKNNNTNNNKRKSGEPELKNIKPILSPAANSDIVFTFPPPKGLCAKLAKNRESSKKIGNNLNAVVLPIDNLIS